MKKKDAMKDCPYKKSKMNNKGKSFTRCQYEPIKRFGLNCCGEVNCYIFKSKWVKK